MKAKKAEIVNDDETNRRPWEHGTYAGQALHSPLHIALYSGGKLHLAIIGKRLHVGRRDCKLIKKLCSRAKGACLHFPAYQTDLEA